MLSKRTTLVAITVMAALSIEVGCGDGSHRTTVRKSLTPVAASKTTTTRQKTNPDGSLMFDKVTGKPVMETVPATATGATAAGTTVKNSDGSTTKINPDGTKTTTDANGKVVPNRINVQGDKNLDVIAKAEQEQEAGPIVTRDALVAGTYELQTLTTSANIIVSAEQTRGIQNSTLQANGTGFNLIAADSVAGGVVSTFVDTPRRVDVPTSFKVDLSGGKWTPNRDQAANLTIQDMITTGSDGKAKMNDSLDNAEVNPASILGILASGTLQKNNTYYAKDSAGVVMVLSLFKTDSQLKVAISFEEKVAADKGTGDQNVTVVRKMFFNYKITADPNGGKPVADKINVTQLPPGQTLGKPGDTTAPPAPADLNGQ